jgi:homoserine dehydrogenase
MGWRLELSEVTVTPLYPPAFASLSVAEFMRRLPELDADFQTRAEAARSGGQALRYAASIEGGRLVVGPQSVSLGSPLGSLSGTDNLVEFYTKWCVAGGGWGCGWGWGWGCVEFGTKRHVGMWLRWLRAWPCCDEGGRCVCVDAGVAVVG